MFTELRRILGIADKDSYTQNIIRNVNDVTISVEEGLSGTQSITITNWNHELAFTLFKQVRDELRTNPRESTM